MLICIVIWALLTNAAISSNRVQLSSSENPLFDPPPGHTLEINKLGLTFQVAPVLVVDGLELGTSS